MCGLAGLFIWQFMCEFTFLDPDARVAVLVGISNFTPRSVADHKYLFPGQIEMSNRPFEKLSFVLIRNECEFKEFTQRGRFDLLGPLWNIHG